MIGSNNKQFVPVVQSWFRNIYAQSKPLAFSKKISQIKNDKNANNAKIK